MRRQRAGMMRVMAGLVAAVFMLGGCTTAELAIDMVKKSQKEKKAAKQANDLAAGTVLAKPRYKVGDPYNFLNNSRASMMTNAIQSQFSTKYKRGLLLVLMAGVLWSTVGLGIRMIQDANVWQILLYRSVSLSAFLAIVIYLRSGASPVVAVFSSNLNTHVAGMSLVAAYSGGIFAIQNTSVANAMLLFATAPFLAAILGLVVLREKVRAVTWFAILISLVGISIMIYDKTNGMALSGSLAALGSALGFAIFTVALRHGQAVDMLPSVFLSGIYAILITGSICALIDLKFVLGLSDGSIALGMGVFQVGAGLILYTVGSKILPAVELTLLSLAEVILGPIWVFLFLGETASVNTLIGGAIVLFAIAGNALAGARRKPPMID